VLVIATWRLVSELRLIVAAISFPEFGFWGDNLQMCILIFRCILLHSEVVASFIYCLVVLGSHWARSVTTSSSHSGSLLFMGEPLDCSLSTHEAAPSCVICNKISSVISLPPIKIDPLPIACSPPAGPCEVTFIHVQIPRLNSRWH
jgi:hypothetical protein